MPTHILTLILASFLLTSSAFAATNCGDVAEELKAMQKAEQSITESLISNHETFASLLQDYSNTLSTSASAGQVVTKEAVSNMSESAKAFKTRGENAEKLTRRLNQASDEVIAKAIECLKSKK